ncbi:hypothetical protein FJY63_14185 [Candidatus Sumerlaeota bacterium]|nr:hypothetical protein [Candidatus Sumerlaeota bacterium]
MKAKSVQPDTYLWQTLWIIAGPRLPPSETMPRSGIFIAPLDEESFLRFKGETTPVPNLNASCDTFVVRYPPRDVVQSRYRLQVDVRCGEQDEAIDTASQIVDRLLLSLTLVVPGPRYSAELRKVRRADQEQEYSAWSQTVGITPMNDPTSFEAEDVSRAMDVLKVIENDETATNAYTHLLTAWQLQDTSGSKPLSRSILQHYILCVEAIVNGMMSGIRKTRRDDIRAKEREFAKEFADQIAKRADKPEAIRQASTTLRDISMINMLPSIDVVGPILGLDAAQIDTAKDFYRFRSRSLSHPGRTNSAHLKEWLDAGPTADTINRADSVARAFLAAYCKRAMGE